MGDTDLNSLVSFLRVAEEGSFSAAAEKLGLSKSAVSQQIAALERRLGLKLLDRTTRRVDVTEAGRLLLPACRRAAAAGSDARLLADRIAGASGARLRIAITPALGVFLLQPLVRAAAAAAAVPAFDIVDDRPGIETPGGGADLAVRTRSFAAPGIEAVPLGTLEIALFASPGYLRAAGRPPAPAALLDHRIIGAETSGEALSLFDAGGTVANVAARSPLTVENDLLRAGLARDGLGIALLPTAPGTTALVVGLERVLPGWTAGRVPVAAFYAAEAGLGPQLPNLIRSLRQPFSG